MDPYTIDLEPIAAEILCSNFCGLEGSSCIQENVSDSTSNVSEKPDSPNFASMVPIIDLKTIYQAFLSTKGMRLEDACPVLYEALHIHPRTSTLSSYKLIKNNVNYKLKMVVKEFPYLEKYGKKLFTVYRVWKFPEIFLVDPDYPDTDLMKKFKGFKEGKRNPIPYLRPNSIVL